MVGSKPMSFIPPSPELYKRAERAPTLVGSKPVSFVPPSPELHKRAAPLLSSTNGRALVRTPPSPSVTAASSTSRRPSRREMFTRTTLQSGAVIVLTYRGTIVRLDAILGEGSYGQVWRVSALDPTSPSAQLTHRGRELMMQPAEYPIDSIKPGAFLVAHGHLVRLDRPSATLAQVWIVDVYDISSLPVSRTYALKVAHCPNRVGDEDCLSTGRALSYEISILGLCQGYGRIVQLVDYMDCSHPGAASMGCRWLMLLELADGTLDDYIAARLDESVTPTNALLRTKQPSWLSTGNQTDVSQQFVWSMATHIIGMRGPWTHGFAATNYHLIREVGVSVAKAVIQFGDAMLHGIHRYAIHQDLKFDNMLVRQGVIMLADFGLAEFYDDDHPVVREYYGTIPYMPMLTSQSRDGYKTNKLDCYSLGIMLWAMAFDAVWERSMDVHARASKLYAVAATNVPLLVEAIVGLTEPEESNRWSMADFLSSAFVRECDVDVDVVQILATPAESVFVPAVEIGELGVGTMRLSSHYLVGLINNFLSLTKSSDNSDIEAIHMAAKTFKNVRTR